MAAIGYVTKAQDGSFKPAAFASRRIDDGASVEQFLSFQARLGMRRLRAIAAILGAAAHLDREKGVQLDLCRRMVGAMYFGRFEDELRER